MYVGIDVAKESLQVCVLSQPAQQRAFENTLKGWKALAKWLKNYEEVWVALEATGTYGEGVAYHLHASGYRVSVVNPARIHAYAQSQLKRHKTDAIDAELIADFCRTQQPPHWAPPPEAERELRALIRHLDDLKATRQAERNRLAAGTPSGQVKQHIEQLIAFLDKQIAEVLKQIRKHIDRNPELKAQHELLKSIPGIGDKTSFYVLGELGDLTRFRDVRQLVALVGLNPQQRQSGRSIHYTAGISRMGRSQVRAALFMPAIVARRHNPILRVFADRIATQGLSPKQVIVAVMRKLLHLAYGVLKHGQPFNPNYLDKQLAAA
jgi:transposase